VIRAEGEPNLPLVESVINTYTIEALVTSAERGEPVEVALPAEVVGR
jgi:hypothetical protein